MMTLEQRPQSYWTPWQALGPDRQWTAGPPVRMVYPVRRPSRPWWWVPPHRGFGAPTLGGSAQEVGIMGVILLVTGIGIIAMLGTQTK